MKIAFSILVFMGIIILLIVALLGMADIKLSSRDWACTRSKDRVDLVCERSALDVRTLRSGDCRHVTTQECVQWTMK